MKILFITHRFPHPPNRGDSIRSFHFLERFSEMGTVHLATLYEQEPSPESVRVLDKLCAGVIACPWGKKRKWFRAAKALACGKTMTEGLFFKRRFRKQLRKLLETEKFDRIVVFCSSMFPYLKMMAGTRNEETPIVVDFVDIDSQKWFDYADKVRGWTNFWKKWVFRTEGRRLRRLEVEIGRRASALMAVTAEEVALYRSFADDAILGKFRISAVPNGVDTEYFDATRTELASVTEIPGRMVFVGALDYRANVDGVLWFVENVLPTLRERFPECELDVVGSRPVTALQHLAESTEGVNLVGTVPDVRPFLKRASVAVIPLQVARGLQNKVLEACAMSRPVVSSVCAAEGIQKVCETDFCVCGTPEEWVETLSELMNDSAHRAELCVAGRRMVEENYSWATQLGKLETLLREMD